MIFFALALSWVKELAENIFPTSEQLFLSFAQGKNDIGKPKYIVTINGLPGSDSRKVALSRTTYDLFLAFANKKIHEDGWMEIKPKNESRTGKTYDINDYNEVKRLLESILNGLFGKNNWTPEQHFNPLKETLFELPAKRKRMIRLKIPGDNISLP